MSSVTLLAIAFLLILISSILVFIRVRQGLKVSSYNQLPQAPGVFRSYSWVIFTILSVILVSFMGISIEQGSPMLDLRKKRSLDFIGYYTSPDTPIEFTGSKSDEINIYDAYFREDEFIRLQPDLSNSQSISTWQLEFDAPNRPLRVNGTCINLPDKWWLESGDEIEIILDSTESVTFRWQHKRLFDPFEFYINTKIPYAVGGGQIITKQTTKDVGVTKLVYNEYRNLDDQLSIAFKDTHQDLNYSRFTSEWRRVFENLTWIRETKGESDSRMGLFIHPAIFDSVSVWGLEIYLRKGKDRKRGIARKSNLLYEADSPVPGVDEFIKTKNSYSANPEDMISYGHGLRSLFVIDALPSSLVSIREDENSVATINFSRSKSWELPKSKDDETLTSLDDFILTSADSYIPRDAFVFTELGIPHTFYAKGRVSENLDNFVVNTGVDSTSYELGEEIFLGSSKQGVRIRLTAKKVELPISNLPSFLWFLEAPGIQAVLILFLLNLGFIFSLGSVDQRVRLSLAWTFLWGLVLTLLTFRLIIAYRVALLPPLNATPNELIGVFSKSFLVSMKAFWVVPLVMILVRGVTTFYHKVTRFGGPFAVDAVLAHIGHFFRLKSQGWHKPIKAVADAVVKVGVAIKKAIENIWSPIKREILNEYRQFIRLLPNKLGSIIHNTLNWAWEYKILLLPTIWILLGYWLGDGEQFLLRISHGAHFLTVISLAFVIDKLCNQHRKTFNAIHITLYVLATLGMCVVLLRDHGFMIYLFSFLAFLLVFYKWHNIKFTGRKSWFRVGRENAAYVLFVAFFVFLGFWFGSGNQSNIMGEFVSSQITPTTYVYRNMILTDTADDVLVSQKEKTNIDMTQLLRSAHQHWQMMLYASEGVHNPEKKFGYSPLSDIGMTYPTSITDCVFAIFILSEHGPFISLLFLLMMAGLFFVLVYGGSYFPSYYSTRLLILILIGGYFVFNTLYMAFANIGTIIFTGQNIPLFSLYSNSDLLQASVLLAVVASLLVIPGNEAPTTPKEVPPTAIRVLNFTVIGLICVLGLALYKIDASFKDNYNFSNTVFDKITDRVWVYDNSTRTINCGDCTLTQIEHIYKDQFNNRQDKFSENAGLYYIDRQFNEQGRVDTNIVAINRHYFVLRSPFKEQKVWEGTILAKNEEVPLPVLTSLGTEFSLRFNPYKNISPVQISEPISGIQDVSESVVFQDALKHDLLDLRLDTSSTNPEVYMVKSYVGPVIYHEGKVLEDRVTKLKEFDLFVLESNDKTVRRPILYLGTPDKVLASTYWRNGRPQHVYPPGGESGGVYTLMRAADWNVRTNKNSAFAKRENLRLTMDINLQAELQRQIDDFADNTPRELTQKNNEWYGYEENNPTTSNIIALTLIESHTGKVLAIPSWPYPNYNKPGLEREIARMSPGQQSRHLQNHNLRRHVIGSTVKPIIYSALATQLDDVLDLENMAVYSRRTEDEAIIKAYMDAREDDERPVSLHTHIAGLPLETSWDSNYRTNDVIDVPNFLVNSRNYFVGLTGVMGTLIMGNRGDSLDWMPGKGNKVLNLVDCNYNEADIRYRLSSGRYECYRVDMLNANTLVYFQENNYYKAYSRLPESLLFTGIQSLFGVKSYLGGSIQENDNLKRTTTNKKASIYLSSLYENVGPDTPLLSNEFMEETTPEPVILNPNRKDGRYLRGDIISMLLGGGMNRWNNIDLAVASARIATGLEIEPRLEDKGEIITVDTLEGPLGEEFWRNNHLLKHLENVGRQGTGRAIIQRLASDPEVGQEKLNKYVILLKTGTLQERTTHGAQSEMLMFTIGKWEGGSLRNVNARGRFSTDAISGFLYLQNSRDQKLKDSSIPSSRTQLASCIFKTIINGYFEREELQTGVNSKSLSPIDACRWE